jgi:hypothetical protein
MPQTTMGDDFFLSARPEGGTQANYFRPKAVTEIVFPDVGMIMYPMFWNKYAIYLHENGYELTEQDHLYLWAERDGTRVATDGVLYYALRSLYETRQGRIPDITVGENAASEWLFKPATATGQGLYDGLVDHFLQVARGQAPSLAEFTTATLGFMSQRFRARCAENDISFAEQFETQLHNVSHNPAAAEREKYDSIVTAFVRAIERCFTAVPALHRTRLSEVVIGSNLNFVRPLLEQAPTATLARLANTQFAIAADEANAFLEAVQAREHGEYLVGSILLIAVVGPSRDRDAILNDLRQLPELYRSRADIVEEAHAQFPEATISSEVVDVLEPLCYFWSVNYFLADGEDLARHLIANTSGIITDDDIDDLFQDHGTAESFARFIELSTQDRYGAELTGLLEVLTSMQEDDVVAFLDQFRAQLGAGESPRELFIALLEWNNVLVDETDHYRVTAPIQENDSATFYGVDEVINWTETLTEAVADG